PRPGRVSRLIRFGFRRPPDDARGSGAVPPVARSCVAARGGQRPPAAGGRDPPLMILNPRRLVAIDIHGLHGTARRARLIRAEFVLGAVRGIGLWGVSLATSNGTR